MKTKTRYYQLLDENYDEIINECDGEGGDEIVDSCDIEFPGKNVWMKEKKYWERSKTPGFNNLLGYADKRNRNSKLPVRQPVRLVKVNNKYE